MDVRDGWKITFWRSLFMTVFLLVVLAFQHGGNLPRRFVVARQYPDFVPTRLQNLAAPIQTFAPRNLVAGRNVVIGLHGEDAFQRLPIIVDVGKYQYLGHGLT